jgi:hypothetical protein
MSDVVDVPDRVPSTRLVQVLRVYCRGLEREGVRDLRDSLSAGRYPWFRAELASALANTEIGWAWWIESIGDFAVANSNRVGDPILARQKQLWHSLFPHQPWPVAHLGRARAVPRSI